MRQAYDQALEGWSKAMEQMVASEEFASASGQFLKNYVQMQESLRAASTATAESLHLPTRDDLARVAELVINVERKVDEIADEAHAVAQRLVAVEARLAELAKPRPAPRRRAKPSSQG
jgi:polyhydroxyalkanoic acid synthase PhaR subunit